MWLGGASHNVSVNGRNGVPAFSQACRGAGAGPTPRAFTPKVRTAVAPAPAIPAPPGRNPARPPRSLPIPVVDCGIEAPSWTAVCAFLALACPKSLERAQDAETYSIVSASAFRRRRQKNGADELGVRPPRQSHTEARQPPGMMGEAGRRTIAGRGRFVSAQGHAVRAHLPNPDQRRQGAGVRPETGYFCRVPKTDAPRAPRAIPLRTSRARVRRLLYYAAF